MSKKPQQYRGVYLRDELEKVQGRIFALKRRPAFKRSENHLGKKKRVKKKNLMEKKTLGARHNTSTRT